MNKNLFTILILALTMNASYAQRFMEECFFVSAKGGLNVRLHPRAEGNAFHVLQYGDVVKIINDEIIPDSVIDNGKKVAVNWVEIEFNNIHKGYVLKEYLSKTLGTIPESSLYHINSLTYLNFEFTYYTDPDRKWREEGKCISYYDPDYNYVEGYEKANQILREKVKLELVDINNFDLEQNHNPYMLDTSFHPRYYTDSNEKYFYLPINNGNDSVKIKDHDGEAYISKSYTGEIEKLNMYVICEEYEGPMHNLVDKSTGESEFISFGAPFFSSDSMYLFSIYGIPTYNYDDGCSLMIRNLTKDEKSNFGLDGFNVNFTSWIPYDQYESVYWLSPREVIIKIISIDNYLFLDKGHDKEEYPAQYLKVTIKE